jgi:hypothetical protein
VTTSNHPDDPTTPIIEHTRALDEAFVRLTAGGEDAAAECVGHIDALIALLGRLRDSLIGEQR